MFASQSNLLDIVMTLKTVVFKNRGKMCKIMS